MSSASRIPVKDPSPSKAHKREPSSTSAGAPAQKRARAYSPPPPSADNRFAPSPPPSTDNRYAPSPTNRYADSNGQAVYPPPLLALEHRFTKLLREASERTASERKTDRSLRNDLEVRLEEVETLQRETVRKLEEVESRYMAGVEDVARRVAGEVVEKRVQEMRSLSVPPTAPKADRIRAEAARSPVMDPRTRSPWQSPSASPTIPLPPAHAPPPPPADDPTTSPYLTLTAFAEFQKTVLDKPYLARKMTERESHSQTKVKEQLQSLKAWCQKKFSEGAAAGGGGGGGVGGGGGGMTEAMVWEVVQEALGKSRERDKATSDATNESVEDLTARLVLVEGHESVSDLKRVVHGRLDTLSGRLDTLEKHHNAQVAPLPAYKVATEKRLAALESQPSSSSQLSTYRSATDSRLSKLESQSSSSPQLASYRTTTDSRLFKLESQSQLSTYRTATDARLSKLEQPLSSHAAHRTTTDNRLSKLESEMVPSSVRTTTEKRLDSLEEKKWDSTTASDYRMGVDRRLVALESTTSTLQGQTSTLPTTEDVKSLISSSLALLPTPLSPSDLSTTIASHPSLLNLLSRIDEDTAIAKTASDGVPSTAVAAVREKWESDFSGLVKDEIADMMSGERLSKALEVVFAPRGDTRSRLEVLEGRMGEVGGLRVRVEGVESHYGRTDIAVRNLDHLVQNVTRDATSTKQLVQTITSSFATIGPILNVLGDNVRRANVPAAPPTPPAVKQEPGSFSS
ncbi:hypothetical protein RQP46_005129 [Phenoliferia psychrophenolica]